MEKFLLIFHGTRGVESPEIRQQQAQKWFNWVDQLYKEGKYLSGEALMPDRGKIVSGNNRAVMDGPFIEAKDMIGGYFLIQVADYDAAVAIAKDCPDFEFGTRVSVHQVASMRAQ